MTTTIKKHNTTENAPAPAVTTSTLLLMLSLLGMSVAAHSRCDSDAELLPDLYVSATPLRGADVDRDRVAAATSVLGAADINRTGIATLTGAIVNNISSASINDTEGNGFQPDILFRGFTASPVAGTPQGLAVYVNGARFNDAFGDTVNWDLIPAAAIDSVDVEASNPLFGLNALGGSINIRLKNGFTTETQNLTAYAGSYGRRSLILEMGRSMGPYALYVAADATHDGGFRHTSTSDLYRLYADLGWRNEAAEVHASITAAHDTLGNPGATPVQALAVHLDSIFTAPNQVSNTYIATNLSGTLKVAETVSLQGVAYFQALHQVVPNGITSEVAPCADGSGLLCNSDASVVTGRNGQPLSDFLHGAAYSGLSVQQLASRSYGAAAQAFITAPLANHPNSLIGGVSVDASESVFAGVSELGGFDPYTREFLGPGVVLDQPSAGVNPVRVRSTTQFYGLYATDVFTVFNDFELTFAGRFNDANIELADELGGPVHGTHAYRRFNPRAGLTYRVAPLLQAYASYSQTNRAPTPQELSCASAAAPCSLLNFFVGDPDLHQVVARTTELGVRGRSQVDARWQVNWNLDIYHTDNTDDIIYESTVYNPNLAFYTNAGRTRRQGVESSVRLEHGPLRLSLGYALTDATFRSPLLLNSSNNPAADGNGQEHVMPGARLPGISRHRATLVLDYALTSRWRLGGSLATQSKAYRFGDEANVTAPLGGYTVLDLHALVSATEHLTVFAVLNNALDQRFHTYGAFGPVADVQWPSVAGGVTDTRTASPGMPIAAYGGIRLSF